MNKLYIKDITSTVPDHYSILNESGEAVYNVDQDFKTFGNTIRINKLGEEKYFEIERKSINSMYMYEAKYFDNTSLTINQNLGFKEQELSLHSDDYDLNLKGDILEFNFEVYDKSGEKVGIVNNLPVEAASNIEIEVLNERYEDVLVSLFAIFEEIKTI